MEKWLACELVLTMVVSIGACSGVNSGGQKAYDIGAQCGGWTITWQGLGGTITKSTSIIDGIAKAVMPEKKLSHDLKGEVASENEAIIVVAGEGPYVETEGDRKANAVTISADDKVMLGKLRDSLEASGKDIPVVAIIIGGRSLDISEYENMFDEIKKRDCCRFYILQQSLCFMGENKTRTDVSF